MTTIRHFERALGRVALVGRSSDRDKAPAITPSSSCAGCASTRTRCASATPTTARRRRRCCSATSRSPPRTRTTRRARWCSPACRTTSSRTRRPTRCSTACTRASTSRPIRTCTPSTRRSPTSSRCSSTSRIRRVLESQIARTRGDLHSENLLGQLAQQFGRATGRGGALRDALGGPNEETGVWEPRQPDPHALDGRRGPHARGAILVAAVFRAFLLIYRARTADLFRIATAGTGRAAGRRDPPRPDAARLAGEAAASAERDPADVHPRDRLLPAGRHHLRRLSARRHHRPTSTTRPRTRRASGSSSSRASASGASTRAASGAWALDALAWPTRRRAVREHVQPAAPSRTRSRTCKPQLANVRPRRRAAVEPRKRPLRDLEGLSTRPLRVLWKWLREGEATAATTPGCSGSWSTGGGAADGVSRQDGEPAVEVHAVRPALRRTIDGGAHDRPRDRDHAAPPRLLRPRRAGQPRTRRTARRASAPKPDFIYRAGCDDADRPARTCEVRRVIRTPGTIDRRRANSPGARTSSTAKRRRRQRFDAGIAASLSDENRSLRDEPFALLHQLEESADAADSSSRPKNGVTVRMYRQGHGDCFLVAFPREGGGDPYTC